MSRPMPMHGRPLRQYPLRQVHRVQPGDEGRVDQARLPSSSPPRSRRCAALWPRKNRNCRNTASARSCITCSGEDSTVVQKLSDLNGAYTAAQIERINREATYRELKGKTYDNYSDVRASSLIQGLKQEYSATRIGDQEKIADLPGLLPRNAAPAIPAGRVCRSASTSETADIARKVAQSGRGRVPGGAEKGKLPDGTAQPAEGERGLQQRQRHLLQQPEDRSGKHAPSCSIS